MIERQGQVVRTVVRLVGRDGDRFALLEYDHGGFGISRNDQVLPLPQFDGDQLDRCIDTLIELAQLHPGDER